MPACLSGELRLRRSPKYHHMGLPITGEEFEARPIGHRPRDYEDLVVQLE
jgi:hypothetical protein